MHFVRARASASGPNGSSARVRSSVIGECVGDNPRRTAHLRRDVLIRNLVGTCTLTKGTDPEMALHYHGAMPKLTQAEIEEFLAGPRICRLGCIDSEGF